MKLRPVLLLTESIGAYPEVLVAYISSVIPVDLLPSDWLIDPGTAAFAATNLKAMSVLRLHKLATIHASMIVRRLGRLQEQHLASVAQRLRTLLRL